MNCLDLSGLWRCEIPGQAKEIHLPGTLDEGGVGHADAGGNPWHPDAGGNEALMSPDGAIATRLTRRYTYEGPARLSRRVCADIPAGRRVFFEAERARCLSLRVNGRPVPDFVPPTLATPRCFEVTGLLTGDDAFELVSDNSYPGLPHDDIVYSSMATDETQTNWNGVLGYVRLRVEEPVFFQAVRVYPRGGLLDVCAVVVADADWKGTVRAQSPALAKAGEVRAQVGAGLSEVWLRGLPLAGDARRWDEDEGNLYELTVSARGLEPRTVTFGVRDFGAMDGHLALNGRRLFLRGETNCAVFPETGYSPMDVGSWTRILSTYRSYGVNCVRFHSHTPPEAAFEAADRLGMLMQPELSHWNPRDAFETRESYAYYRGELEQCLLWLANHPSFVMLTLGNELHAGEAGHQRMDALVELARGLDATRLYANGSNAHYGARGCDPASDFYTSSKYFDGDLRATHAGMDGPLNHRDPDARLDYAPVMERLRETYSGPVFSFEVGQYEMLPDFDELADFRGVTRPDNLERVRQKVRESNLKASWKRRVEATGELALRCYRAEVEAALRTEALSGISLLGLQDFPGQGTALVGMLNSHLRPKPFDFARPERFAAFFQDCLPLVLLERFTYTSGERLAARVRVANYGKSDLTGRLRYALGEERGELAPATARCGGLSDVGGIDVALNASEPAALELKVEFAGCENAYPIWVYPGNEAECPAGVYEARRFDARARAVLEEGGVVYLSPDSDAEALPRSIQAQFSTDFWSVGTFPSQPGGMGQLIDAAHPLFCRFPTRFHTDWQWWPMANRRAFLLPEKLKAIVEELDSCATLRPMAQLFEGRCGPGWVLASSLGLHQLRRYPEARALQSAIYAYLASDDFRPSQEIAPELLKALAGDGGK